MIDKGQTQAIIYCRISDPKQAVRGDGLRSQETRCREFAKHRNYAVMDVFQDMMTGGQSDRTGMNAMLAYLRKHKGTVVVIDHLNRLARDVRGHFELRDALTKAGGILESPSIEFKTTSDALLVEHMLASVAQYQRQHNGEQTKNWMKARVQNGYWVFQAPAGYTYKLFPGRRGKMLVRDEPVASVVQEALEGYASGRFESQADVMRFLQDNPLFPKDASGIVRHQRVGILLAQCAYAGYIEAPSWGVPLRAAQHEALISYQTYQRIQERLNGIGRAPMRKNLNEDFPLRGFVTCADCETPLTACWSKGAHSHHPYYLCPKRGCASYGKSIRRDKIEGEFEAMLRTVQPSEHLFRVACKMFERWWNRRSGQAEAQSKELSAQLVKIERQVAGFLERILDASVPSVIGAYEDRVRKLEEEKCAIKERMANIARPATSFERTLRTALGFLANPCNIWNSERLEDRRTVLKLVFTDRLRYARKDGFRTAGLSLPFKALGALAGGENGIRG
jgi:site-specific DNA recombinase